MKPYRTKEIQTGSGVVSLKFTETTTEIVFNRCFHPDHYDWKQIKELLITATAQACEAANKGVTNYWDTL